MNEYIFPFKISPGYIPFSNLMEGIPKYLNFHLRSNVSNSYKYYIAREPHRELYVDRFSSKMNHSSNSTEMMINLYNKTYSVATIIFFSVSIPFCVLAIFVFTFFIRKRYLLHKDIKHLRSEEMYLPNCQARLKNLKIKSTIANFVIAILFIEFISNSSNSLQCFGNYFHFNGIVKYPVFLLQITSAAYVPLLCMLLRFLRLVYLHAEYRYTVLIWAFYISIRITVYVLMYFLPSGNNEASFSSFTQFIGAFFVTFDFIQYVRYSKEFYAHLKSREKEARLFYNRRTYLENKDIRLHFKFATALVVIGLFFYLLVHLISLVYFELLKLLRHTQTDAYVIFTIRVVYMFICSLFQIIYRLMFNLNYLYFLLVLILSVCHRKYKHRNINEKIKPIVRRYHKSIYGK